MGDTGLVLLLLLLPLLPLLLLLMHLLLGSQPLWASILSVTHGFSFQESKQEIF
jgi:hypothetical protein